jgi:hypothetical protein
MVRRYEEPIEVRAGVGAVDLASDIERGSDIKRGSDIERGNGIDRGGGIDCVPDPAPSAFLWRGRLYIVREVIGHWRERRAWWREALDPAEDDSDTRRGMSATHGLDCPVHMDCLEQEVWRVEASPGRLAGSGVYDLGMNGPQRGWRLLRVAD